MPGALNKAREKYIYRIESFCRRVTSDRGFVNQIADRWQVGYIRKMAGDVIKEPLIP